MNYPGQPAPAQDNPVWVNWVVLAVVVGAVFGMFYFRPLGLPKATNHPAVDRPLPILELQGLLGTEEKTVTLGDLEGQVVLVSFWGPWAPDCTDMLAPLDALRRELANQKDFRLMAVACGRPGEAEHYRNLKAATERVLQSLGIGLPVYVDAGGGTRGGLEILRISAGIQTRLRYPTTFVLDRKGFIRGVWEGWRPGMEKEIRSSVVELLNESDAT